MSMLMLPTEALKTPDETPAAAPTAGDRALTVGLIGLVLAAALAAVFVG